MSAVEIAIAGALVVAALLSIKVIEYDRLQRSLVSYRLHFPRGLSADDVESFLAGLSGLLLPWWRRWATTPFVAIEVRSMASGIEHIVSVPDKWQQAIENLLQAAVPSVRYERIEAAIYELSHGAEYGLNNQQRELRIDDPASLSLKLLSSLQPLRSGQSVVIQWLLTPAGPVLPAHLATKQGGTQILGDGGLPTTEAVAALNKKQARPLLFGVARIGALASSSKRTEGLIRQTESAWHETRSPGVHFNRRPLWSTLAAKRTMSRLAPLFVWPGTYNSAELSGLIGWPIEAVAIPGVPLGGSRHVPASPLIPSRGMVIGDSTAPGDERPLAQDAESVRRPTWILGPTGSGKSELIGSMLIQDLEAGHAAVLLDPKGDLASDILARIPEHRVEDVIYLDAADDQGSVVGLNPLLSASGVSSEVAVENLVGLFKSLYRTSWGPRTDDVMRGAVGTLASTGNATLCEVPLLLLNPEYRRRVVGTLDDPIGLQSFWGWYEALSDQEKLAVVGPSLNKLRAFTMRPRIRTIVGQVSPKWSIAQVIAERKILIVSLATGLLGDEAAQLLGALVVAELWNAVTARASQPAKSRTPVRAYLDEWARFVHLPTPMASILAEARGLGLGVVAGNQHVRQLPEEVREAALSNTRSKIMFQLPAGDARLMARELGGVMTADDLQGLGPFEVAAQLYVAGSTQAVATARTRKMPPPCSDPEAIRSLSRQRYGVDRQAVETAIRERQMHRVEAPLQRRVSRRSPS